MTTPHDLEEWDGAELAPATPLEAAYAVFRRWLGSEYDLDALRAVQRHAVQHQFAGLVVVGVVAPGFARRGQLGVAGAVGHHAQRVQVAEIVAAGGFVAAAPSPPDSLPSDRNTARPTTAYGTWH